MSTQRNLNAAQCRTANGGGLQHHHGQPNVKQGGAAGYLEKEARTTSAMVPALTHKAATEVTSDYSVEEAKKNQGRR